MSELCVYRGNSNECTDFCCQCANDININNMADAVLYGDEGGAIDDNARSHDTYERDNQGKHQQQ